MSEKTLNPHFLWRAYAAGYFPMPDPDTQEIGWYRPDPRAVIPLDKFHYSRSLKKTIRQGKYRVTFDRAFEEVMLGCADRPETWINQEFIRVYTVLARAGVAHSVEVWKDNKLVGGVYGVAIGGAFFAESKFHKMRDASKVALAFLVERLATKGFKLLEVQFLTPHLESLGAIEIPGSQYDQLLHEAIQLEVTF